MNELYKTQIVSKLVTATPLTNTVLLMRNFKANLVKILRISKY